MNHLDKFQEAWGNPNFTKIELDPVDVNRTLREHYTCKPKFNMTMSQLWDMEINKAARPDLYIPSVIKQGSVAAWGRKTVEGIDTFIRVSEQRLWLDAKRYGTVIENVHVDHKAQMVTFIGEYKASSKELGNFSANDGQAIFHVQHGVIGDEDNPLNTWKIVHLTSDFEQKIEKRFQKMNHNKWLPEYIEAYLCNVAGVQMLRRS